MAAGIKYADDNGIGSPKETREKVPARPEMGTRQKPLGADKEVLSLRRGNLPPVHSVRQAVPDAGATLRCVKTQVYGEAEAKDGAGSNPKKRGKSTWGLDTE